MRSDQKAVFKSAQNGNISNYGANRDQSITKMLDRMKIVGGSDQIQHEKRYIPEQYGKKQRSLQKGRRRTHFWSLSPLPSFW